MKIKLPYLHLGSCVLGFYQKVTALKDKGKKVLLSLGGWQDSVHPKYGEMVTSDSLRKQFVKNAVKFIKENEFSGIDLDWEFPSCPQVGLLNVVYNYKPDCLLLIKERFDFFYSVCLFITM